MSRNRICMEQMTRLDIDPRVFIIFPFGEGGVGRRGGEWVGLEKILCSHHVPVCSYWCSPCSQWAPCKISQVPNSASLHPISFAQRFSLFHLYGLIKGHALHPHVKVGLGWVGARIACWMVHLCLGGCAWALVGWPRWYFLNLELTFVWNTSFLLWSFPLQIFFAYALGNVGLPSVH